MRDRTWSNGVYMAEFDSAPALTRAMRVFAAKGYTLLETYSPVPMSYDLKRSRSRLPVIVFIAGVFGGIVSYAIQWYANVYAYPLDIGGRPAHAIPAFIIPTFEGTIFAAAIAAFIGFFVLAWYTRHRRSTSGTGSGSSSSGFSSSSDDSFSRFL